MANSTTNAATRPIAHTIASACRHAGIGRTKLYELISTGAVDARRVGGRTVITDASIVALVENAPRVGGAA